MTISVQCKCGKRFRAKDEHAGKKTKCPDCGHVLTIGKSSAPDRQTDSSPTRNSMPVDEFIPKRIFEPKQVAPSAAVPRQPSVPALAEATDSPLGSDALEALKVAESFRRPIRHAAVWFRIQFLFGFVLLVVLIVMFLAMLLASGTAASRSSPSNDIAGTFVVFFLIVGTGVGDTFCYFAYKATWDLQRWAPMVMLILNGLAVVWFLGAGLMGTAGPRGSSAAMVAGIIFAAGPAIVGFVCYRAWNAIPHFLRQPAWCRQTLIHCGL